MEMEIATTGVERVWMEAVLLEVGKVC